MNNDILKVQLEVTTNCNSNCIYCPRDNIIKSGKRKIEYIEKGELERILEELRKYNEGIQISISGLGEPLLHPSLFDIIKRIKEMLNEKMVHLRLNSNCHLLDEKKVDKIIHLEIDAMTCSLNMATPELYGKFRNNLDYEVAKRNIIKFLELKGDRKPSVRLRINLFDVNIEHLDEAYNFWIDKLNNNDIFSLGRFSNWAGKINRDFFVKSGIKQERTLCKFLGNHLTINLHGDSFPCCVGIAENRNSDICLGNIIDTSFEYIFGSKIKQMIIEEQMEGIFRSPCNLCDSWGVQIEDIQDLVKKYQKKKK